MRPKGVGGWFVRRIIKKANLGTEGQEVAAGWRTCGGINGSVVTIKARNVEVGVGEQVVRKDGQ